MGEASFLFYNGKITKTGKPLISADNRSFRYGDGFFETMKMIDGKIILADHHFERLFASLKLMQFQQPVYFTRQYLEEQISLLAEKNFHYKLARIRLTIFRGDGGLYDADDHFPHHLIQTWQLNPANNVFNENGLVTGIFKNARKVCDDYSHIKNNNYLANAMAALWVKQERLNDALLQNPYGRIADATIANVFIVKNGMVKTPALTEGAVNGVMRKYLLECLRKENMDAAEANIHLDDIENADEIFLTNAIYGMRWVKQCGDKKYTNQLSSGLYKKFVLPLF